MELILVLLRRLEWLGPSKSRMFSFIGWKCMTVYYSFGHQISHTILAAIVLTGDPRVNVQMTAQHLAMATATLMLNFDQQWLIIVVPTNAMTMLVVVDLASKCFLSSIIIGTIYQLA